MTIDPAEVSTSGSSRWVMHTHEVLSIATASTRETGERASTFSRAAERVDDRHSLLPRARAQRSGARTEKVVFVLSLRFAALRPAAARKKK
jgi:hypothetical protein